jgi:hypothetical protein
MPDMLTTVSLKIRFNSSANSITFLRTLTLQQKYHSVGTPSQIRQIGPFQHIGAHIIRIQMDRVVVTFFSRNMKISYVIHKNM